MSKEKSDQQKANELLQKLHAAFLNDGGYTPDEPEEVKEPEQESDPVVLPEAEPVTEETAEPEETEKSEKAEAPAEPVKQAPTSEPKHVSAAPAAILALTEDRPDAAPSEQDEPKKVETPVKKSRPNTVKIPPRRRSGQNTGAIGARQPAKPTAPKSGPRPDDITIPRTPVKKAPAVKAAPPSADSENTAASLRPSPSVIVDFDKQASSTVEPIENTEASEAMNATPVRKPVKPQKKAHADQATDVTSAIAKQTGLDESDIALIFELGYENELGRLVGYEALKKLKYEHLRNTRQNTDDYYAQAFGYRGNEYTSATPRENVLAAYAHDRKNLIIRVAVMVLVSALLFFMDFPTLFSGFLPEMATNLPYLLPALGFVLFSFTVYLMHKRILSGWRSLLRFSPSPYSIVAVVVPFAWIYNLVALITAGSGVLPPMNFAVSMMLLLLLLCDALRLSDEMRTFRMISSDDVKTVLEEAEPRKKKLLQGNRTVKIINDEAGQSLYRVRRAREVVGFFRRVNDLSASGIPFMRMIICVLVCAAAGGLIASLVFNPLNGILVFAATLIFAAPACASFLFFDPLRRANRHLTSRRSVLVGEGSVNEYSESKTVIFNDTDSFRAKRQTQINLQDGDEFRRDIRLAEALFRKIGGTLSTVDQPILMGEDPNTSISLIRLTETGIEALIDNKYRILAGDATFLMHSGVEIPRESTDRSVSRSRGVSALFVAINGTLKLTYEIAYTMNHSFRDIIALLARTNTTLAVQSYDPSLNNAFLHIGFADGDDVVRVIKPAQFETPTTAEITDTGAVTLDGPLATAYPLRAASLIVGARRNGFRALVASIFPGALLAFLLSFLLPANLLPFLPLMAVGYRFLWLITSWVISAYMLRRRAIFEDTRENLANEDF